MSGLPSLNAQISRAVSIADVTRIARQAKITRLACGYRIERSPVAYTEADKAWFSRPITATEGK